MQNRTVVFLYTELAEYIRACMEALAKTGVNVTVFAYPVNVEAPFKFDTENTNARYLDRTAYNRDQLLSEILKIQPDLVVCSGWIDKDYLHAIARGKGRFKAVVALDNQMPTTLRERIALMRAKVKFRHLFDAAWVPGPPQVQYAQALGFESNQIFDGFYTADHNSLGEIEWNSTDEFPKRFVYVGRYVDFKGVKELWEAFKMLNSQNWELFCAGHGEEYPQRDQSDGIHHLGFVQPADLNKFVAQGGVFVLPSKKEPWGVVVHEFASAGYPLLCSDKVGAAAALLKNEENGLSFKSDSTESLARAMKRMVEKSDAELWAMGKMSKKRASRYTKEKWVKTALHILN